MKVSSWLLVYLPIFYSSAVAELGFDPSSYLEVYPDPRNQEFLAGRTPLYFALIQSLGGPGSQYDTSGAVAGVKVALDRINNDSSILPGYTLHYTFSDSRCNRTKSLKALFSDVLRPPTKIALIGAGCSPATEPTAEISHFYNISQISCVSSSNALKNRRKFPFYFQLLSSEETLAYAYYGVIKEYGWRQVSLIVQNENLFTVTIDILESLLRADNITCNITMFDTSIGIEQLGDTPFDTRHRIFLLSMYAVYARPLLCKAYEQKIFFPKYLLITVGWYTQLWWREQQEGVTCSVAQRERVLRHTLACSSLDFLNGSSTGDLNYLSSTGITGEEFLKEERAFLGSQPLNLTFFEYSQYCYDATWTLTYALNNTINSLNNVSIRDSLSRAYNVSQFTLSNYSYTRDEAVRLIFSHLSQTNFAGITRSVSFGPQGIRRLIQLSILQYRDVINQTSGSAYLNWVKIASVARATKDKDEFTFSYESEFNEQIIWQGLVPYDGRPNIQYETVHPAVVAVFVLLSLAGITLAVICFIFNFYFRESKLVKLASTKLNSLIVLGAIVLYVDIIFTVVPSTDATVVTVFCNLTPWLSAIGYSLCYGTILAKMCRVYYIFNNPTANKKRIHDWTIMLAVMILVAVDVVIIIIYTIVAGRQGTLKAEEIQNPENPSIQQGVQGIITDFYVYVCSSLSRVIFLAVLYGYKMVLQVLALILAFSTRKVKVKGLDDSKYIAAAIYVTSMAQAVVIVATFTLTRHVNAFAVLFSISFLTGTTVILLLVFIPLMVGLYKDPKGDAIFSKVKGSNGVMSNSLQQSAKSGDANTDLRKRVACLEAELQSAKKEIEFLGKKSNPQVVKPTRKESVSWIAEDEKQINGETTFTDIIVDQCEEKESSKSDLSNSETAE